MVGAILIVVALLVLPPLVLMSGMVAAAVLGETGTREAESRFEGSELLELSQR